MAPDLAPKEGESPLAYVERADAVGASFGNVDKVLRSHFGMEDSGEIKALKLKSFVFWKKFYESRAKGILERGGTRYAAVKFIERKNGQCGQKPLTDEEIGQLVDAAGVWAR